MQEERAGEMGAGQVFVRRIFKQWASVEPAEFGQTITAFFLFFCLLGGYFAVRPVRETFGTVLGDDVVADLYVWTSVAAVAIIPLYGIVCSRFKRSTFLPWIYASIALLLAITGLLISANEDNAALMKFFYVAISVANLFIVSVFWSFLLEVFQPHQTKRLFPAIAAGGTLGALVGPWGTAIFATRLGNAGVLFVGALVFVVAILLQRQLLTLWARANAGAALRTVDQPMGGNLLSGIGLIFSTPYLIGIAIFVFFLATANTLLYFEQLNLVAETFTDRAERLRVFGLIDAVVQTLTILSQVVITGRVAKKWGVVPLVTIVPLAMVGGFLALAAWYSFAVLVAVMIARRVGEYAFVRPGREMLFSGLDLETKYKAKNTVDVAVYRGADAATAQMLNAIRNAGVAPQAVAMMGAGTAIVWALNGLLIGRRREKLESAAAKAEPAPVP